MGDLILQAVLVVRRYGDLMRNSWSFSEFDPGRWVEGTLHGGATLVRDPRPGTCKSFPNVVLSQSTGD